MPAGKKCEICSKVLILHNTRDIKRKRFCSRKCLGLWMVKSGKLRFKITEEIRNKMRESKLKLLKTGWKPVGWRAYDIPIHFCAHHGYFLKGSKRVHRIVAELKIGRPLMKGEVVHHIDENKLNNDPDNLEVMTNIEHTKLHMKRRLAYASSIS